MFPSPSPHAAGGVGVLHQGGHRAVEGGLGLVLLEVVGDAQLAPLPAGKLIIS